MADLTRCSRCGNEQPTGATRCLECGMPLPASVDSRRTKDNESIELTLVEESDTSAGSGSAPPDDLSGLSEFFGERPPPRPAPTRTSWPLPNGFTIHSRPLESPEHPGAYTAEVLWSEKSGVTRLCIAYWFPRVLDLSTYQHLSRRIQQEAPELIVAPVHLERLTSGEFRSLLIERDLTARSLRTWAGQRGVAVQDVGAMRAILTSLAATLDFLHKADLWHLNLRPEVVEVYEANGRLRASLGGLSKLIKASHIGVSTRDYPLTAYAAPELDYGDAGACSDFWSLGVILYELIVGSHPFGQDGHLLGDAFVNKWLDNRMRIDYTAVPAPWKQLLRGLLTHDYPKRWGLQQIYAFLRNEPLPEPPKEYPTRLLPFKLAPDDPTEVRTPGELAALLATRWSEARGLASTPRISRWLHEDGSHERQAANIAAIESTSGLSLDRKLVAILVELAPSQPRTYMGHALTTIGDIHALASSALSVNDGISLAEAATPRDVIESLYDNRILSLFPPPGDDTDAVTQIDARWRQEVAEYQDLRSRAGSVAADVAPDPASVDTLSFLLACVTNSDFLSNARRELRRHDVARETPWYAQLAGDVGTASPARLWLLQSLAGPATAEAHAHQEARRQAEAAARRAEVQARQARRAALAGSVVTLLAAIPGAVLGAGLGLLGGFVVGILVYLPTAFVVWVYSWFVDWDTGNVANRIGFYAALFTLVAAVLAGVRAAMLAVSGQDGVASRIRAFLGIMLLAGILGYIGWWKQDTVAGWVEDIPAAFAWNKGWDCGDSGFVSLGIGQTTCSFRLEQSGRVFFDGRPVGNSLVIPTASGAPVAPSKITAHLTEAPGGRYILFDAVREHNSARYVLDKAANRAILVTSNATSAGKYAWSPDGRSIVSFVARAEGLYVEAYRLTDSQTARKAAPSEGYLSTYGWKDSRTFEATTCSNPPGRGQQNCYVIDVTLPQERGEGNEGRLPAYRGPENSKVGDRLKVVGDEVNVRIGPSTTSPITGRRSKGDVGALMRPPVVAGSIRWYRLRFRDGLDGWVAGRYLVETTADTW